MEPEDQRVVGTAEDPPQVRGDLLIERDVLPRKRKRKRHADRRSIEPDKNRGYFRPSSVAIGDRIQNSGTVLGNVEFSFRQEVAAADRVPSVQHQTTGAAAVAAADTNAMPGSAADATGD